MSASNHQDSSGPVLLFDGECGLCHRIVRSLLRLDQIGVLRFAPLQGPAAQEFLRTHGLRADDFETLIFVPEWARRTDPSTDSTGSLQTGSGRGNNFLLRTDGVIAALRAAGANRRAALLALVPRALRDAAYRVVARSRQKFFGPWRSCPLPRPEWAERFFS